MLYTSLKWLSLLTGLTTVNSQAQQPIVETVADEAACHNACTALLTELGQDVVHYGPPSALPGFLESFQSPFQRDVTPACVVTPPTSKSVSQAITVLRSYSCPLAVKSGGHAPAAGMSNVEGGVTIDLKLLDQVEYLGWQDWDGTPSGGEDGDWKGQVTRLGPGNRWSRVYEVLDARNISVVGGRASTVGVGGFVMGGGISFLSHKNGWSADTVRNFELVQPNGTLTNVNHRSNPRLFKALRGGGSNFGIVTRFDMETFSQEDLWGGYRFYTCQPADISERREIMGIPATSIFSFEEIANAYKWGSLIMNGVTTITNLLGYSPTIKSFLKAFEEVMLSHDGDHHSHLYWSFSYVQQVNTFLFGGQLVHTQGKEWPDVFKPYKALRKPVWSQSRRARLSELAKEEDWNDAGSRRVWLVTTLRSTSTLNEHSLSLHELLDLQINIFIHEVEKMKNIKGVIPSLTFQPITRNEIRNFKKNGGNAFGMEELDAPLIILALTIYYDSKPPKYEQDDLLVRQVSRSIVDRWEAIAKEHGMWHPYKYVNYADGTAAVSAGYGEENKEWLRGVKRDVVGKKRWDIGGFKV